MRNVLYVLGELTDEDISWMLETGKRQQIAAGTVLIHEGRPISGLYILIEGRFSVTVGQKEITQLGPGEMVGEMSFVEDRPPSATVRALQPSFVMMLPRALLSSRLRDDLAFAGRFYRSLTLLLAHRLRTTTLQLSGGAAGGDDPDELSSDVLDTVYMAGARFERILNRLREGT